MSAPVLVLGELTALERAFLLTSPNHRLLGEVQTQDQLRALLDAAEVPLNLVVVSQFAAAAALLAEDQPLFRRAVARLFLIGGKSEPFLPIDPRLKERYPELFESAPDPAFGALLTSGEGVIWLPGDLCLWRHWDEALQEARFLSALPAFCLATLPEPLPWLRLFRTIPARVQVDARGTVTAVEPSSLVPNCFVVVAVDGAALSRFLTANTVS